jgi:hypothetical protein
VALVYDKRLPIKFHEALGIRTGELVRSEKHLSGGEGDRRGERGRRNRRRRRRRSRRRRSRERGEGAAPAASLPSVPWSASSPSPSPFASVRARTLTHASLRENGQRVLVVKR